MLPQAYIRYSEDKIFHITKSLGEKAILQGGLELIFENTR